MDTTNQKNTSVGSPIAALVYYLICLVLFPVTVIGYVLQTTATFALL